MIARLSIDGAHIWSRGAGDVQHNAYVFETGDGVAVVDPHALDDAALATLTALGGVRAIVCTGGSRSAQAEELGKQFGAAISSSQNVRDGDELFAGARALRIGNHLAVSLTRSNALVTGAIVEGVPAGALHSDASLDELRALWSRVPQALLPSVGMPVLTHADDVLATMLDARFGNELYRLNAGDVTFVKRGRPSKYDGEYGEIGLRIGARQLGYWIAKLQPGTAFCPMHWHVRCEEFFYVIDGTPSIRTPRGTMTCRAGDYIAFPAGERGAHQVRNDSEQAATILLVGMEEPAAGGLEVCFYPDSEKVGLFTDTGMRKLLRSAPELDYFDGEL